MMARTAGGWKRSMATEFTNERDRSAWPPGIAARPVRIGPGIICSGATCWGGWPVLLVAALVMWLHHRRLGAAAAVSHGLHADCAISWPGWRSGKPDAAAHAGRPKTRALLRGPLMLRAGQGAAGAIAGGLDERSGRSGQGAIAAELEDGSLAGILRRRPRPNSPARASTSRSSISRYSASAGGDRRGEAARAGGRPTRCSRLEQHGLLEGTAAGARRRQPEGNRRLSQGPSRRPRRSSTSATCCSARRAAAEAAEGRNRVARGGRPGVRLAAAAVDPDAVR